MKVKDLPVWTVFKLDNHPGVTFLAVQGQRTDGHGFLYRTAVELGPDAGRQWWIWLGMEATSCSSFLRFTLANFNTHPMFKTEGD